MKLDARLRKWAARHEQSPRQLDDLAARIAIEAQRRQAKAGVLVDRAKRPKPARTKSG